VRKLHPATYPSIVLADTVGFLRNLPNHLLASFRSTLNEALDADLLVIVIDGSDPEWEVHLATTREVLGKVEADDMSVLYLVNKLDQMSEQDRTTLEERLPEALLVSSRCEEDVARVHRRIAAFFDKQLGEAEFHIPFSRAALRAEICANARILSESFDEQGGLLRVRADEPSLARWRAQLL
jgi:GTP-binding protein HflX